MAILTEGMRPFEFVIQFGHPVRLCTLEATVVGTGLQACTVLGYNATNYVILAPAASDGSQTAAAILIYPNNSATPTKNAILYRSADVNIHDLVWPAGITAPQKTTAIANLALKGIRVRSR
jgi:Bacteriophage lambda head decoration protein D